jgi:hypothetical protein
MTKRNQTTQVVVSGRQALIDELHRFMDDLDAVCARLDAKNNNRPPSRRGVVPIDRRRSMTTSAGEPSKRP